MSNTFSQTQINALIAAGIDLNEFFGATTTEPKAPTAAPAKPAKVDGRNHAARKHNFEARMVRREETTMGGLTKAERSALYAANPSLAKMAAPQRKAAWTKIVKAYKAAN